MNNSNNSLIPKPLHQPPDRFISLMKRPSENNAVSKAVHNPFRTTPALIFSKEYTDCAERWFINHYGLVHISPPKGGGDDMNHRGRGPLNRPKTGDTPGPLAGWGTP